MTYSPFCKRKLILWAIFLSGTVFTSSDAFVFPINTHANTRIETKALRTLASQRISQISSGRSISTISTSSSSKSTSLSAEKKKTSGVYARPSAAIERGSGFYVPGLEGSRVRILFGILCLILSYVNNAIIGVGDSNVSAVEFSTKLVTFYGVLLLMQGLVEAAKENGLGFAGLDGGNDSRNSNSDNSASAADAEGASTSTAANTNKSLDQMVVDTLEDDFVERVRWASASYVALTPATHVLLLESDNGGDGDGDGNDKQSDTDPQILYGLGTLTKWDGNSDTEKGAAIQAAVDTISNSKGGRVSVPESHPCASLIPEDSRRCILLQRIKGSNNGNQCLMVGSNQLLAAFTKNDLKWLGSLADSL